MQHAYSLRLRRRTLIVIALIAALVGTSAPALAWGDGEGDLEEARAWALEVIDAKTNKLQGKKETARTDEAWAIYDNAIEALAGLRARVLEEDNITEIHALREQALAIYYDAIERGAAADEEAKDPIEEARQAALNAINAKLEFFRNKLNSTENPEHREIYAWALHQLEGLKARALESNNADELWNLKARAYEIYKEAMARIAELEGDGDDEEDRKRDERRKLENAREHAFALIEKKTAMLRAAAESAHRDDVADIYRHAAEAIWSLNEAAGAATSIGALQEIEAQVWEIYEAAMAAVAELRDEDGKDPEDDVRAQLESLAATVRHLMEEAGATAEKSPDTYAALMATGETLLGAIAQGLEAETEDEMIEAWAAIREAKHDFRLAYIAHINAVLDCWLDLSGEPIQV